MREDEGERRPTAESRRSPSRSRGARWEAFAPFWAAGLPPDAALEVALKTQVLAPVAAWVFYFTRHAEKSPHGLAATAIIMGVVISLNLCVIVDQAKKGRTGAVALSVVNVLGLFLGVFAGLYLELGSAQNFHPALTRLDALYVAVGTFTTAGTGAINAVSDTARAVQTAEMVVSMSLVFLGIGALTSRLFHSR